MSEKKNDDRRIERKKRRKRSRMLAFIATIIVLAVMGVGAFLGITAFTVYLADKSNEKVVEATPEVTPEVTLEVTPEIIVEEITPTPEEIEPDQEPVSEDELLDEMIDSIIAEMTLEDKVAGLFIVTPEQLTGQGNVTKAGEGTKTTLEQYPVGGIIYSKENIKSEADFKDMLDNTNSWAKYPLFIAAREEGGDASGIAKALGIDAISSAEELKSQDITSVYSAYNQMGIYLSEHGFNLTFAPNADVLDGVNNKYIGSKSFGDDTNTVTEMALNAYSGLKDAGVTGCFLHFPGQGYVDGDPATGKADTDNVLDHMRVKELVPFKNAVDNGVSMIMVGNFTASGITEENLPCSMSKEIITDILRKEMQYDGVVITDAMNSTAISEYYASDEVAYKAVKAGADMILMPEDFKLAHEAIVNAVKEGNIDENRINDSLKRIYRIKYASVVE